MCGNFALFSSVQAIKVYYQLLKDIGELPPNEDIRPTQKVPVVVIKDGRNYLGIIRWGLIPHWATDTKIGDRLFNARAETIDVKTSFKQSFLKRRCLIPANGFSEWRKPDKAKFYFSLRSRELFSFAGIWEVWKSPEGVTIPSCTIITTEPNSIISPVHDRMPVILKREDEEIWLKNEDTIVLKKLLIPYPAQEMQVVQK